MFSVIYPRLVAIILYHEFKQFRTKQTNMSEFTSLSIMDIDSNSTLDFPAT